jgi:hypothetical protein
VRKTTIMLDAQPCWIPGTGCVGGNRPITATEAVAITMQQRGERHLGRMAGVSERGVDHVETMQGSEILARVDQIEKLDKVARRTFGLDDIPPGEHFTLNVLNLGECAVEVRKSGNSEHGVERD